MQAILQSALGIATGLLKRVYSLVPALFRHSSRLSRRTLLTISALLTIWYSALQVKGACGALTPMQCLITPLAWVSPKVFGPLEAWARPAPKEEPPGPVVPRKQTTLPSTEVPQNTKIKSETKSPPDPSSQTKAPPSSDTKRPSGEKVAVRRMLTVANRGSEAVASFWASACSDRNWGPDRLVSLGPLSRGYQRSFDISDGTNNCCYDLRVRFANGEQNVARNMDVCRFYTWTVTND